VNQENVLAETLIKEAEGLDEYIGLTEQMTVGGRLSEFERTNFVIALLLEKILRLLELMPIENHSIPLTITDFKPVKNELLPWILDDKDPIRERVEARRIRKEQADTRGDITGGLQS